SRCWPGRPRNARMAWRPPRPSRGGRGHGGRYIPAMPAEKITVPGAGRQLDVLATGPPDARTVLLHDGTPAGLLAAPPFVPTAAAERGLRLVQYNRPGYGGPPPAPRRRGAGGGGGA